MNKFILLISISLLYLKLTNAQSVANVNSGTIISIANGTNVGIVGSITLQNGATLTNNGSIIIQKPSLAVSADFINLNTIPYRMGSGTLIFQSNAGFGIQQIRCIDTIQRINVNTDSLALLTNVVSDKWYLIRGKVNTSDFYAIATSTSALAFEADVTNLNYNNSWVNGRIRRYFSSVTPTYLFPVGNSTGVRRIEIDNIASQPLNGINYIDAAFRPKRGNDAGILITENGTPYTSVNAGGAWHLTPNNQPTSGKYNLRLYFTGFTGLTDNTFGILGRQDSSSIASDWIVPTGSSLNPFSGNGRKVIDGYAQRNNLSSFHQFGIGSSNVAFPIVMGDFTATRISKILVQLKWNTLQEQNLNGFFVQRRLDFEPDFKNVASIDSKGLNGNSITSLDYKFIDSNSHQNISYYRLLINDKNQSEKYSIVRAVKPLSDNTIEMIVYPIPAKGVLNIDVKGQLQIDKCYITDMQGRSVLNFNLNSGNNKININSLASGSYIVVCPNAFGDGKSFTEKIIISN